MSTVNVLVAIDVSQAVGQVNLNNCVFMMDTNGFLGSNREGGDELLTTCFNGDTIVWSVTPIDPNTVVSISGFTGNAVPITINPAPVQQNSGTVWSGRVNAAGTNVQYSISLLVGNTNIPMSFDPFITANNRS